MKNAVLVFERIRQGLGWATMDYIMEFSNLTLNTEKFILALLLAGEGILFMDVDDDEECGVTSLTQNDVLGYFENVIKNS